MYIFLKFLYETLKQNIEVDNLSDRGLPDA